MGKLVVMVVLCMFLSTRARLGEFRLIFGMMEGKSIYKGDGTDVNCGSLRGNSPKWEYGSTD